MFKRRIDPPVVHCEAPPGSPDKINELAARFDCNEVLWHPDDATIHPLDQAAGLEDEEDV